MSLSFITLGTYIEEHLTKSLSTVIITHIVNCLHCRSSEGNLGDDLRLGRRAPC